MYICYVILLCINSTEGLSPTLFKYSYIFELATTIQCMLFNIYQTRASSFSSESPHVSRCPFGLIIIYNTRQRRWFWWLSARERPHFVLINVATISARMSTLGPTLSATCPFWLVQHHRQLMGKTKCIFFPHSFFCFLLSETNLGNSWIVVFMLNA